MTKFVVGLFWDDGVDTIIERELTRGWYEFRLLINTAIIIIHAITTSRGGCSGRRTPWWTKEDRDECLCWLLNGGATPNRPLDTATSPLCLAVVSISIIIGTYNNDNWCTGCASCNTFVGTIRSTVASINHQPSKNINFICTRMLTYVMVRFNPARYDQSQVNTDMTTANEQNIYRYEQIKTMRKVLIIHSFI